MRIDLKSLLLIAMLTGCSSQPDPPDNVQSGIATSVESLREESNLDGDTVVPVQEGVSDTTPTPAIDTTGASRVDRQEVRNSPDGKCRRLPGHMERGTGGPLTDRWVEGPIFCDPEPMKILTAPRAAEPRLIIPPPPARAEP
jgi:hypothetical protein